MTIPQRTVSIAGVFASNASTAIPETPIAGTSYRDENMTTADVENGWPYKTIVDSAQFNEAMYQYSTIAQMQEKYGFIPWSALTDYVAGSFCLGSDGTVYQALQATGPSTTSFDPVNDNTNTYWQVWLENYQLGIGDVKQSLRTANHGNWILCNGQALSRTTYPLLFSIIGTNFGAGDGSTTFNVPDYRGKFLRGLGGDSATDMYTTQAEGLPNHTHAFGGSEIPLYASGSGRKADISGADGTKRKWITQTDGASNAIYGASNHVTPINQAINYFIRAR